MTREEAAKIFNGTVAKAIAGGVHQIDIVAILETIKHDLLRQHFESQKPSALVARMRPKADGAAGEN